MDRNVFVSTLSYLQSLYGNIDDLKLKALWLFLKSWDEEKFKMACHGIIETFIPTTQIPFPLPPHFSAAIGEDQESKAIRAMKTVRQSIRYYGADRSVKFEDRKIHAVIQRYGGWAEICQWNDKDWLIKEKSFIAAYEATTENEGPEYLIGIADAENMKNGFGKFVNHPALITGKKETLKLTNHERALK